VKIHRIKIWKNEKVVSFDDDTICGDTGLFPAGERKVDTSNY